MKNPVFYLMLLIILSFHSVSNAVPNNYNGKGDLLITKTILNEFYDYVSGPKSKQPEIFFITEDKSKIYKKTFRNYGQKSFINGSGNIKRHKNVEIKAGGDFRVNASNSINMSSNTCYIKAPYGKIRVREVGWMGGVFKGTSVSENVWGA